MAGTSGIYKGSRRVDLNKAAMDVARQLDSTQAADSKLDVKVKVMVIGMTGEAPAWLWGRGEGSDKTIQGGLGDGMWKGRSRRWMCGSRMTCPQGQPDGVD